MKKILPVLMTVFASPLLFAHPGHGGDVGPVHEMQHGLWWVAGFVFIMAMIALMKNKGWYGKK